MGLISKLGRMWLTRCFKPFIFKNEYDEVLPYMECDNLGLYVHIPFCKSLCNFCPYCKVKYDEALANEYIDYLIKEIHLVALNNEKKQVTSLYFGGGTPALVKSRIKEIIEALKEHFIISEGIGIELHPDDVTIDTLTILKDAGVTKISIGIQSFQDKYQYILGRKKVDPLKLKEALDKIKFETVSMDFIFALPNQTLDDLIKDIETAFMIGANHFAMYPFIDFNFTPSNVKAMKKREKERLLNDITKYCMEKGYTRNTIWTFSNNNDANYSSMTRDNFLGFGASATTLLNHQFKINTFSIIDYIERIKQNLLPTSLTLRFTKRQRMVYYLFWTAYSTKVNKVDFDKFFKTSLQKMYGFELLVARIMGFVKKKGNVYEMTLKGAFYYHYYENFYTLAYIDKMWGILRHEAFPKQIKL